MALFSEQYIDDYRIRRATLDDVAIVMATYYADDDAHIGFQIATEALLQEHWTQEESDLALDAWIAETYDGQIIATADVAGGRGDECLNSSVAIDPAHSGRGLEDALVSLVEARARQIAEWACADECACPEQQQTAEDAATPTARATRGEQGARIRWEVCWEVCPDRAPVHADDGIAESSAPSSARGVVVVPAWAWSSARTPTAAARRRGRQRERGHCAPTTVPDCATHERDAEGPRVSRAVRRVPVAGGPGGVSRGTGTPLVLDLALVRVGRAFPARADQARVSRDPRPLALCA